MAVNAHTLDNAVYQYVYVRKDNGALKQLPFAWVTVDGETWITTLPTYVGWIPGGTQHKLGPPIYLPSDGAFPEEALGPARDTSVAAGNRDIHQFPLMSGL